MKGGKSVLWVDENMAYTFVMRSINFLKSNKDKPVYIYCALYQPHIPMVPHPTFAGKSGMGSKGDGILEAVLNC